ncbi:MAG TPA: hypothetical protein VK761_10095 [Solirubrobacteraceae bacterium]|nr:hypothetical protein [Solirubrobacteraceae bacterium]
MANRSKGGPGRSRKRRRSGAAKGAAAGAKTGATASVERTPADRGAGERATRASDARAAAGRRRDGARRDGARPSGFKDPQSLGERPEAPWHPFPLSELLIFVGAIATVVGLVKLKHGLASGGATLIAGVVAVLIGTVEFSFREHRSGYRSHTVLLALLPTVVLYTGTLLIVAAFVSPVPVVLKVAPLALALPLFALLFKVLRGRFQDARRERVFAGER